MSEETLFHTIEAIMTNWGNCQITKVKAKKEIIEAVRVFNADNERTVQPKLF